MHHSRMSSLGPAIALQAADACNSTYNQLSLSFSYEPFCVPRPLLQARAIAGLEASGARHAEVPLTMRVSVISHFNISEIRCGQLGYRAQVFSGHVCASAKGVQKACVCKRQRRDLRLGASNCICGPGILRHSRAPGNSRVD